MMNMDGIRGLLADHQKYHSEFQLAYFMIASNGLTPYGMYKQCLRELDRRHSVLCDHSGERELLEMQLRERWWSPWLRRLSVRVRVAHTRRMMQFRQLCESIKDCERETQQLYEHARDLKAQVGELTDERRRQLDVQFWQAKLRRIAAMDIASGTGVGEISRSTLDLLWSVPLEMRLDVLADAREGKAGIQAEFGQLPLPGRINGFDANGSTVEPD